VEESEALQAKAATAEFERLRRTEFAGQRVELIHGQMPSKQKAAAMEAFARGDADVLVATSVIEVGIDVPNATVMLIEAAERYGLSQLHQLRGRVGRGEHPSLCILFGDPRLPRLEAIAAERDGFRLAEIDLELRGAGDVLGTRQHGLPEFRVARLPEDTELLVRARRHADALLLDDPGLERPEHVRVVAGEFKGRRLVTPRGARTRPTADRVREALFSILGDVSGARVLDLFAGSGALGIEALSRGAASAEFVESDRRAVTAIQRNLAAVGAPALVRAQDALRFLERAEGPYDLVFCDPPYDSAIALAELLSERLPGLTSESARIVTESDKRQPLLLTLPLLTEREYGDTRIAIHGR
jgi:16S rRNA (guanine(966)-N(2))-methyltransferase RsmD